MINHPSLATMLHLEKSKVRFNYSMYLYRYIYIFFLQPMCYLCFLTSPLVSAALFPPWPSCPALPERAARLCPSARAPWWPRSLWRCCWGATSGPSWLTCQTFCHTLERQSMAPGNIYWGTRLNNAKLILRDTLNESSCQTTCYLNLSFAKESMNCSQKNKTSLAFCLYMEKPQLKQRPFMSFNCCSTTGAQTLTIWQRHLFSLTSFSNERFSMMSASASAPSWSCLLASLKAKRNKGI